jgi:integrase
VGRRMTKIRLKYIKEYRAKGETYRYFRRKGCQPIKLPGEPGSREFNAAYEAALGEKPIRSSTHNAGTMGRLIADYYGSVGFANLKPSSRTIYRIALDPVSQEHGHRLVRDMGRDHARKIVERIGATRPGAANTTRKALKVLMEYAVDTNVRTDNPVRGIKGYRLGTRHAWTDAQLAAYEARWPLGTRERLAYASLLYSGQRGGDVVKMKRPDAKATSVTLTQEKTGVELTIPICPEWRAAINAGPGLGLSLLGDSKGRPILRRALTELIAKAVLEAGLPPECKAHGLRKAMMRRLAEAGRSTKQIAAMSGHKSLKEVERYTEAADQARLAEEAMSNFSGVRHLPPRK